MSASPFIKKHSNFLWVSLSLIVLGGLTFLGYPQRAKGVEFIPLKPLYVNLEGSQTIGSVVEKVDSQCDIQIKLDFPPDNAIFNTPIDIPSAAGPVNVYTVIKSILDTTQSSFSISRNCITLPGKERYPDHIAADDSILVMTYNIPEYQSKDGMTYRNAKHVVVFYDTDRMALEAPEGPDIIRSQGEFDDPIELTVKGSATVPIHFSGLKYEDIKVLKAPLGKKTVYKTHDYNLFFGIGLEPNFNESPLVLFSKPTSDVVGVYIDSSNALTKGQRTCLSDQPLSRVNDPKVFACTEKNICKIPFVRVQDVSVLNGKNERIDQAGTMKLVFPVYETRQIMEFPKGTLEGDLYLSVVMTKECSPVDLDIAADPLEIVYDGSQAT